MIQIFLSLLLLTCGCDDSAKKKSTKPPPSSEGQYIIVPPNYGPARSEGEEQERKEEQIEGTYGRPEQAGPSPGGGH